MPQESNMTSLPRDASLNLHRAKSAFYLSTADKMNNLQFKERTALEIVKLLFSAWTSFSGLFGQKSSPHCYGSESRHESFHFFKADSCSQSQMCRIKCSILLSYIENTDIRFKRSFTLQWMERFSLWLVNTWEIQMY